MGRLAKVIDAKVANDRKKPRQEARFRFEIVSALDETNKRVLRNVLGNLRRPDVPHREVEYRSRVTLDEFPKRPALSRLETGHQLFVAQHHRRAPRRRAEARSGRGGTLERSTSLGVKRPRGEKDLALADKSREPLPTRPTPRAIDLRRAGRIERWGTSGKCIGKTADRGPRRGAETRRDRRRVCGHIRPVREPQPQTGPPSGLGRPVFGMARPNREGHGCMEGRFPPTLHPS